MQHTRHPDSDAAGRTGDGGYLLEREFALLHSHRIRLWPVANLFNFGQFQRGYPASDFEQCVADISTYHPLVLDNYRAVHHIAVR